MMSISPYAIPGLKRLGLPKRLPKCNSNADRVLHIVAAHFGVSVAQIKGRSQKGELLMPRHASCYFLRHYTGLSFEAIGELLRRHHTSIIHSLKKVADELSYNENFIKTIKEIENEI